MAERSQERWDLLVKGDFEAAYAYLSPGSKAVIGQQAYVDSLKKGFWKSAKVRGVKCATPESCEVTLTIEYEFQGRRTQTPLREDWIKEGSNWWYLYKR